MAEKNNPEVLQIIDQDIEANTLIEKLSNYGFYLHTFETYALYNYEPDYGWFVFKTKQELEKLNRKPQSVVLLNNLRIRLLNMFS